MAKPAQTDSWPYLDFLSDKIGCSGSYARYLGDANQEESTAEVSDGPFRNSRGTKQARLAKPAKTGSWPYLDFFSDEIFFSWFFARDHGGANRDKPTTDVFDCPLRNSRGTKQARLA